MISCEMEHVRESRRNTMEKILIQKVKENDVIYNTKSTYYRDTEVRQRTWDKIGRELHMKAEEARSAWDKLRRCFINARNRRRTKQHECGITIHPWKYEKDMAFLWPFVERNRRTLNYAKGDSNTSEYVDSEPEDSGSFHFALENTPAVDIIDNVKAELDDIQQYNSPDESEIGHENIASPLVETSLGHKRPHDNDVPERMDYKRKCWSQENTLLEMDECDLFFMSMSKMTKTLSVLERAKVKLAVSNAVFQALISVHSNVNALADSVNETN